MKNGQLEINGRTRKGKKVWKRVRIRSMRKKAKLDNEYTPQYNRYTGYR